MEDVSCLVTQSLIPDPRPAFCSWLLSLSSCLLPPASCSLLPASCLLPPAYGQTPPVKILAKLRIGKKLMIFWKLFILLPGTIT